MNTLAHGSIDDLISAAGSGLSDETPEAFVAQLTCQIVRLVEESGMELHDWQRRVLIPLEDRMRNLFGAQVPRNRSQLTCWLTRAAGEPVNPRSWLRN